MCGCRGLCFFSLCLPFPEDIHKKHKIEFASIPKITLKINLIYFSLFTPPPPHPDGGLSRSLLENSYSLYVNSYFFFSYCLKIYANILWDIILYNLNINIYQRHFSWIMKKKIKFNWKKITKNELIPKIKINRSKIQGRA